MKTTMLTLFSVVGIAVLAASSAVAQSCPAYGGRVSGSNTVDYVNFSGNFSAGTYTLGFRAEGSGSNKLTVKVQQRKNGGGWKTIASDNVDLGDVNGCGYESIQYTLTSSEEIRYRFSRKVGTNAIDYDWDHDFTVVWGGPVNRCLNC